MKLHKLTFLSFGPKNSFNQKAACQRLPSRNPWLIAFITYFSRISFVNRFANLLSVPKAKAFQIKIQTKMKTYENRSQLKLKLLVLRKKISIKEIPPTFTNLPARWQKIIFKCNFIFGKKNDFQVNLSYFPCEVTIQQTFPLQSWDE